MEADALAKRAVTGENDDTESLAQRKMVAAIEALEPVVREDTWMAPMVKYLTSGDLPADKERARVIRIRTPRFVILGGTLYRSSYQGPLLKCLVEGETEYVLREVHEGCCGNHGGSWVEAEPLAKIIEGEVMKFLWNNIVCQFGIPRKLVSDNGRQFQGQKLAGWCAEMDIKQAFTSVSYPQSNGQTEVTNRTIVRSLQARLHGMGKDWVEEIPSMLWAYRTTPHTATQ
ncbi:uncharacterized protein [Henckelia pumila]|uniref:uncharacterized protein n=1 Tax=Henckelia pumila TaxID=405737 RepID=UPI003C6E6C11